MTQGRSECGINVGCEKSKKEKKQKNESSLPERSELLKLCTRLSMRKYDWSRPVTAEKIKLKIAEAFNKAHSHKTAAALWKRYFKKRLPDGRWFRAYEGTGNGSGTGKQVFHCYVICPEDNLSIGDIVFHRNPYDVYLHLSTIEAILE